MPDLPIPPSQEDEARARIAGAYAVGAFTFSLAQSDAAVQTVADGMRGAR